MGTWNNAHYLLSDEMVGFAHNVLADYQSCDFATFRSRLLELINGQSEMQNILNDTSPCFQKIREEIGGLKEVSEQLLSSYQKDQQSPVTLSQDGMAELAEEVIRRLDDGIREDRLEGILSRIREMTEKKETLPVRKEVPDYGPKINQLMTAVNSLHQQNRELMDKLEELDSREEQVSEDDAFRMQEDNRSLLQALNKYKAAYITLKNERNDLSMQLEKLKKENFLRIRRKELQDALLEQKEQEIARLKEELAACRKHTVRQDPFTGISISQPENGSGAHAARGMTGTEMVSRAARAASAAGAGTAEHGAGKQPALSGTKETPDHMKTGIADVKETAARQQSGSAAPARSGAKTDGAGAGNGRGASRRNDEKVNAEKSAEQKPKDTASAREAAKEPAAGTQAGRPETTRPAGRSRSSRASSKTAGSAGSPKENDEKQTGGTGIERAKKR